MKIKIIENKKYVAVEDLLFGIKSYEGALGDLPKELSELKEELEKEPDPIIHYYCSDCNRTLTEQEADDNEGECPCGCQCLETVVE